MSRKVVTLSRARQANTARSKHVMYGKSSTYSYHMTICSRSALVALFVFLSDCVSFILLLPHSGLIFSITLSAIIETLVHTWSSFSFIHGLFFSFLSLIFHLRLRLRQVPLASSFTSCVVPEAPIFLRRLWSTT